MSLVARLAVLLLLPSVAVAQAPAPEPTAAESFRTRCLDLVARRIRYFHLAPEKVDGPKLCDPLVEEFEAGVAPGRLDDELHEAILAIHFDFATPGRVHDRRARYRLPFEAWMPRLLSQTSGGETHDTPGQYHAFDFLMPSGTRVLAAREGTVAFVADGTEEGVSWKVDAGNVVYVLHADGSWASYVHLRKGVPVRVGQRVERGELVGYSGNTGFSRTPHLHFNVQQMDADGEVRSVPIRFGAPGKPGYKPEAGTHVGILPASKRELRVFVDGQPARADASIPIAWGARPRLRVELEDRPGAVRDVTRDPRVRYETMTIWNLYSPAPGELVIETVPQVDPSYVKTALPLLSQSEGLLFVYHGVPADADFSIAQVRFQVLPAAP